MKRKSIWLTVLLVSIQWAVFHPQPLWGQITTATILGAITDETGALIPGVTVTIRNEGTGLSRTVISDDSGKYLAPRLPVGTYEVSGELTGFKRVVISGLVLQVDQTARIDLVLEVGALTDSVEVISETVTVKTEVSDVSMVVDNQRVTELPLNGRVYFDLNLLDSGTSQRTGWRGSFWGPVGGATFSFNGAPTDANQYLVDGIMAQETVATHPTLKVTIDNIQEFKQAASQFSAESGFGSGAQVSVVTKGGTNQIHGTAYWFLRNDALDARNFFDDAREDRVAAGLPEIPEFTQNQFGFAVGGPIIKDKTFFFFSYEGTRIDKSVTRAVSVPTIAMRAGDFSGLNPIYDPATTRVDPSQPCNSTECTYIRDPFPNNIIPTNRHAQEAVDSLDLLFPLPDRAGVSGNLVASPVQDTDENQYSIRVDHEINDQNSVFGRYTQTNPLRFLPFVFSALPNHADNWDNPAKNAVFSYTRVFSPNTLNEFKLGFNRFIQFLTDFEKDRDIPAELGISRLDSQFGGHPTISIAGFSRTGGISNSPNDRFDNTYVLINNLTHTRGDHRLSTGVSFRHYQNNRAGFQPQPRGQFVFNGTYTTFPGAPATGHSMADFLLGFPFQSTAGIGNGFRDTRWNEFALFLQDDWQIHPNLTLNLGLRYEYYGAKYEVNNRYYFFDRTGVDSDGNLGEVVSTEEFVRRGFPERSYNADKLDFAPRLGLAWRPFGGNKTVVRAGYGMYHYNGQGFALVVNLNPNPETRRLSFDGNRTPSAQGDPLFPDLTLANAFPLAKAGESLSSWGWQEDWKSPYNQVFSLYVQREVMRNTTFEVGYVGNKGTNLMGPRNINRPEPGPGSFVDRRPFRAFSSVFEFHPYGDSSYHAFKFNAQRRFSDGLSFRTSWTVSKGLNITGLGSFGESTETIKRNWFDTKAEKGRTKYDARNRFTFSASYALPFSNPTSGVLDAIIGGWQINGILILQDGTPIDTRLITDNANTGGGGGDDYPDRVGDPNEGAPHTIKEWFNTDAFALPAALDWGDAGKNIITGPGTINLDFSIFKNFFITENQTFQFRAEFFNILNHANFDVPNGSFGTSQFGQIFSAGDGRQIQFAFKYIF